VKIVCANCGKKAIITASKGCLCRDCWSKKRLELRKERLNRNLDACFSYVETRKVSVREAKIINDVMSELEKNRKSKKRLCGKVYK
jgi:hypothetical protein